MRIELRNVTVAFVTAIAVVSPLRAYSWPVGTWESFATSADGTKIAALSNAEAGAAGGIYISTNSGATWRISTSLNVDWEAVASSADGSKLIAASGWDSDTGIVYISTNYGGNWTQVNSLPTAEWNSVSSSADGKKLTAVAVNVPAIYTSTNSGTDWTRETNGLGGAGFDYIACSADGTKLIAAEGGAQGGQLYTSSDSGANWLQASNAPVANWYSVASSANGSQLLACSYFAGNVYISTNAGLDWDQTRLPTNGWNSVASSADGTKLVALANSGSATVGVGTGGIWTSTDSGITWVSNKVQSASWTCAAMSADGNEVIAGLGYPSTLGAIYVSQAMPSPVLKLMPCSTNFVLSWIIPSTNFVLQQSPDLISWNNVTNSPTLNLTNLQNQIVQSPSNDSGFYRLATP
jgi:hypothetical protein